MLNNKFRAREKETRSLFSGGKIGTGKAASGWSPAAKTRFIRVLITRFDIFLFRLKYVKHRFAVAKKLNHRVCILSSCATGAMEGNEKLK